MAHVRDLPGAVLDDDGVLRHLGSPLIEQRALAGGRAVAVLGDRAVITVAGEDRLSWLDSITSQATKALTPGVSTELLVLDPNGHVEHAASVVDDGATTWLITDRADAPDLVGWLRRMRFRLRVDPQLVEDVAVIGGTAAAVAGVDGAVAPVWTDPWPDVADGGWGYAAVDPHPGGERDWTEVVIPLERVDALVDEAIAGRRGIAGVDAAEALRIAAWRPRRSDVDERMLPHEVDWLRTAVHLAKGCYRGQETVAKVHNLGHPPRRIVALQLDGSDSVLPVRGAEVFAGEQPVGAVLASAWHYDEGPIALAIVRRSTPADAAITVRTDDGPIAATAETVVPPDAGATAGVPRLPRLGRRAAAS